MNRLYGYMYGNKGKRKFRSPMFAEKHVRDMYARADFDNGFRVRKFDRKPVSKDTYYYGA